MSSTHADDHETQILRAADGDGDDSSRAAVAKQIAQCDDCLAYVAQTIETLSRVAGKKRAAHVAALDKLLDEVMIVRAGLGAQRRRVPAG